MIEGHVCDAVQWISMKRVSNRRSRGCWVDQNVFLQVQAQEYERVVEMNLNSA
jgi:hypothetical protein